MGKWKVDSGQWPANGNPPSRRGISLMEVLISMFVLAVGLLGVAALIPAGRHEIVEATKLETAAMVGRNAFRDLQTRGYLNARRWWRQPITGGSSSGVYDPAAVDPTKPFTVRNTGGSNSPSNQAAFAIDPLGRTAPIGDFGFDFPALHSTDPALVAPRLMRIVPFQAPTNDVNHARGAYDNIFRSGVDLTAETNATNRELPPNQRFFESGGVKLRRMSDGNYSWLATVASDPSQLATNGEVTVSVAVFYKRIFAKTPPPANEAIGEYVSTVSRFPLEPTPNVANRIVRMPSGGEMVLGNLPTNPVSGKLLPLKPGQWIMLAGFREEGTTPPLRKLNYYHWYRVLSAANPVTSAGTTTQSVTLAGQDWNIVAANTQVYIFENIINVYEKSMPLEIE